jgi:hypothetical protein
MGSPTFVQLNNSRGNLFYLANGIGWVGFEWDKPLKVGFGIML